MTVLVFDVNGTLSDLSPLATRFSEVGAPGHLATTWFASVLRDGFALAAAGGFAPFSAVADGALRDVLSGVPTALEMDAAVEHVMAGFSELGLHPDVPDGIRALAQRGLRLVTLSNGSADVAERLLSASGIRDAFSALLSVDDARVWKPAAGAYAHAARVCAVDPGELLLVAAHPWDVDGASRAGLRTAWVDRDGAPYPPHFLAADDTVRSLEGLVDCVPRC